jgi:predicted TIM-barrel fold metal-dependent hydrolase
MIFDVHARLSPRPGAVADLLSTMDSAGIGRAAVAAGGVVDLDRLSAQITGGGGVRTDADNGTIRRACAESGGRLLPFYFGNPHRGPGAYRRDAHLFRGLELSPAVHGVGLDDRRTAAYVAVAADAGHPVYVVCLGRPGARADDLVNLARRFPSTTFLFGHCGHIGIDAHGLNQITPQPNIVAEASGCLTVTARLAVQRLGPARVLFGSEYPLQHPSVELAKFAALGLALDDWRQIAWTNAHRIFGEDAP